MSHASRTSSVSHPACWVWTVVVGFIFLNLLVVPTQAQVTTAITPTTGVGNLNTTVNQAGNTYNIGGGTRPGNGPNLFHSFGVFSVGGGDIANFANDMALPTSNILGRVTGGQVSNIFGTLQTTGFGNANLFLMNLAGVVFGPTATLNVGGAVNITTADYFRMADQLGNAGIFYANPLQSSVLTTAPVVAFGFLTSNPAPITVQGSTLSVPQGQSISLVGGNVSVQAGTLEDGSTQAARLSAPGGQIQIASVASPGEVLYPSFNFGPNVNGESFGALGNITLSQGTTLAVSSDAAGTVVIRGGQLAIEEATVSADTGNADGAPVAVDINLAGDMSILNDAVPALTARSSGSGNAGEVLVRTANLTVTSTSTKGAQLALIDTHALSEGQAGKVTITTGDLKATGRVWFIDGGTESAGNGNDITITAKNIVLDNMEMSTGDFRTLNQGLFDATGSGGNIHIIADSLEASFHSMTTGSFVGQGGSITLEVGDIQIKQGSFVGTLGLEGSGAITVTANSLLLDASGQIEAETAFAPGGDITITAKTVELRNASIVRNQTSGNADAGNILITATDHITLSDGPVTGRPSGFYINSIGVEGEPLETLGGHAGRIVVTTPRLEMSGGARIDTTTETSGRGGDLTITATQLVSMSGERSVAIPEDFFSLGSTNAGGIFTRTIGSEFCSGLCGDAGQISITTGSLNVGSGSKIDSGTNSTGRGGAITVQATDAISLTGTLKDGTPSGIFSRTLGTAPGSGSGGLIEVQAPQIALSNQATISASTSGSGNAGTVNIQTGGNFVMSGGTVATSASQGQGGNITVNAGQQVQMNSDALISASSTGPGNAGDILVSAGDAILLNASKITTEAAQASGGNVTLMAPNLIQFVNSTVSSSVQGGVQTVGGNITIDPQFVVLQNSQIIAQAFQGQGGNITITAGVLLVDGTSVIDASSQFGVSGTVSIQSPLSNLSQVVNPLQRSTLQAAALLRERCAVRAQSGTMSSLTVRGRDVAPAAPGGMLAGPLLSLEPTPGPASGGAAAPGSPQSLVPTLPVLAISADLLRPLARGDVFGVCGS